MYCLLFDVQKKLTITKPSRNILFYFDKLFLIDGKHYAKQKWFCSITVKCIDSFNKINQNNKFFSNFREERQSLKLRKRITGRHLHLICDYFKIFYYSQKSMCLFMNLAATQVITFFSGCPNGLNLCCCLL